MRMPRSWLVALLVPLGTGVFVLAPGSPASSVAAPRSGAPAGVAAPSTAVRSSAALAADPLGGPTAPVVQPGPPAPARAPADLPVVLANDNRVPAGTLQDGELHLSLVVAMARWHPEAEDGPYVDVPVFAEEGGPPQIPAPLIRVPEGTTVVATVRNALADSTLYVFGLETRPLAASDSIAIPPGETRTIRFLAGEPGTYLYRATAGVVNWDLGEREQLGGAFVVDAPGARTDDRIFVMNVWGQEIAATRYRNAVAINGKGWPYTERITATVGDSVRWRVVNATTRPHPMHLHGFYFRVDAHGSMARDTLYAPADRRLAVTELLRPFDTMAMVWSPDREGNWVFHCHLAFHVVDVARLDHDVAAGEAPADHAAPHELHADPRRHMAGLVLGLQVQPNPAITAEEPRRDARRLRLFVNEGTPRRIAPRALGYVLQRDAAEPAADSVELPGSVLVLTRDEPTDITVVNRLPEPTAVHWHGIELESWSDGIPGWSGMGEQVAPAIAPADSFVARLTLPRAGTFIYHTHLNDIEQLTSGLYGALVVLEPGETWDPVRDQVYVAGWDSPDESTGPPNILVNGDSTDAPVEIAVGETIRMRFIDIGPAAPIVWSIHRNDTSAGDTPAGAAPAADTPRGDTPAGAAPVLWRARARDGADLPPHKRVEGPARLVINVGMTADQEFTPTEPGEYVLTAGLPVPGLPPAYRRRIVVR